MRLVIEPGAIKPPAMCPVLARRRGEQVASARAAAIRARMLIDGPARRPAEVVEPDDGPDAPELPQAVEVAPTETTAPRAKGIRLLDIVRAVCKVSGVSIEEMESGRKPLRIARARFAVAMIAKRHTNRSLSQIGYAIGRRDHTTVMHAMKRGFELLASDPDFAGLVEAAERELGVTRG